MNCQKCGQEMEENTKVCSNCGFDMGSDQDFQSDSVIAAKKSKNGSVVIISVAVALVVLIGIFLYMVSFGGYDRIRGSRLCDLGDRYLSELDYESAIAAYEAAIEIESRCEEAYLGLAEVYIEQEDYEKVVEILEAGLAQIESEAIRSKLEEVEELMAEGTAQEYAVQQDQNEQKGTGTESQVQGFYEKYAELYSLVDEAFTGRSRGTFDRYLTFEEREHAYSGLAEQLEQ